MLLTVQPLSAATLYKTLQGCSNLISVSLPPQFSKTKCKAALELITCYAFYSAATDYRVCSCLGGLYSLIFYAHKTETAAIKFKCTMYIERCCWVSYLGCRFLTYKKRRGESGLCCYVSRFRVTSSFATS